MIDDNEKHHDNNQPAAEVSCGIKQLCTLDKLVNQLYITK